MCVRSRACSPPPMSISTETEAEAEASKALKEGGVTVDARRGGLQKRLLGWSRSSSSSSTTIGFCAAATVRVASSFAVVRRARHDSSAADGPMFGLLGDDDGVRRRRRFPRQIRASHLRMGIAAVDATCGGVAPARRLDGTARFHEGQRGGLATTATPMPMFPKHQLG